MTTAGNDKPKTNSGTAAGTGAPKSANFDAILAGLAASGGAATSKGPVFTEQEASAYVQAVYQQLLGRNAVGVEYRKGVNAFLSQSQDTSVTGRQQAIEEMVQSSPEFVKRTENTYLDAIYNEVAADVRRTR
jgi:hypothetical protein